MARQHGQERGAPHEAGGGAWASLSTLVCGQLGAGILSLPYAAALVGGTAAVVLIVVMAAANVVTLRILAAQVDVHRAAVLSTGTGGSSYERVATAALGARWGKVSSAVVLLCQWGSLVGFLVILVSLAIPVVQHRWGGGELEHRHGLRATQGRRFETIAP